MERVRRPAFGRGRRSVRGRMAAAAAFHLARAFEAQQRPLDAIRLYRWEVVWCGA